MLKVYLTTLGFHVKITPQGVLEGTHLHVGPFARRFDQFTFNKRLRCRELVARYRYYDKPNLTLYFGRFALEGFLFYAEQNCVKCELIHIPSVKGAEVDFNMKDWVKYKNDLQKKAVEYIALEEGPSIRSIALQTGDGKTGGTIWGIQRRRRRTMITMSSRLEQWKSEILKFTDLDPDQVYTISGESSLEKLFWQIDKKIFPAIILGSIQTLQPYLNGAVNYSHLPGPDLFCEKLDIGMVGGDEYHEWFHTNFLTTLRFNPEVFLSITATTQTSDAFVTSIMDSMIPKKDRLGEGIIKKYTNVFAYKYMGGGGEMDDKTATGAMGYSQGQLEKFFLKKGKRFFKRLFFTTIKSIIDEHYISVCRPGEKLLVLLYRTELCHVVAKYFRELYPEKKVCVFISGDDPKKLPDYDIIVSTPGSAGTGRDIKMLRTTFSMIATNAENRLIQQLGRLRPPDGEPGGAPDDPIFCYLYFSILSKHQEYELKREMLYRKRGLTYNKRTLI